MHPFATNAAERQFVPPLLAGLAILATYGIDRSAALIGLQFPWWLSPPSVMGIYGLLSRVFDRLVWQWRLVRGLGLVDIPAIDGEWCGEVESSFGDDGEPTEISVRIFQDWRRILIRAETENSVSVSKTATVLLREEGALVSYEYLNEPSIEAPSTMRIHRGTARLELSERSDKRVLEGFYYTGPQRGNVGRLSLYQEL